MITPKLLKSIRKSLRERASEWKLTCNVSSVVTAIHLDQTTVTWRDSPPSELTGQQVVINGETAQCFFGNRRTINLLTKMWINRRCEEFELPVIPMSQTNIIQIDEYRPGDWKNGTK